ncbi:MAG: acyl-[ACP]--phospholipid O-acyltransferase [Ancalomicrobiaceae bacterium]|nr:acyl-[ACP]--phospholipid O-acyltransferase [Ancalomicrobiaceae bacterium]
MSATLLSTRRFLPLFLCQFFSALNDNFLKTSLLFLINFHLAAELRGPLSQLAGAALMAPYFLLSALGGEIADRYDKALFARRLKFAEIGVAALAVTGFWLHSIGLLFVVLALYGTIAALFDPVKYGILPDHLKEGELPAGNALVQGGTFLAVLLGAIGAGFAASGGGSPATLSGLMIALALVSWASSRYIPSTGEAAPTLKITPNIFVSTFVELRALYADKRLFWLGHVNSWFWLIGAVILSLLPQFVTEVLGGNENVVTLFSAIFAVAIALGSGLASLLSAHRVTLIPTPIAAVLIGLFSIDLGFAALFAAPATVPVGALQFMATGRGLHVAIDLFCLAIAGGLYVVPTFVALQAWAHPDRRARAIAAVAILNAFYMTVGGIGVALIQSAGIRTPSLLIGLGLATLAVAVWIFRTLPVNAVHDLLALIYRVLFRVEIIGQENLKAIVGHNAVITPNHVSFLDAGLIMSLLDGDPVFAIDIGMSQKWWVKPFLVFTSVMTIDPFEPMSTRSLIQAVRDGRHLVIFPEGRLTVTGALMKVYDGAGLIADRGNALVLPVRIEGLERTPLSFMRPNQVRKAWFPKVTVTILPPRPLLVDPDLKGKHRHQAAGHALYDVMSDAVYQGARTDRSLFQAILAAARREGPVHAAVEDPIGGALSYKKLLIAARVLGTKLMPLAPEGGAIGVMLPNANGAAVTVLALLSAARVPAMINFTSGVANILSAARAAGVEMILTSRAFIEKAYLTDLVEAIAGEVTIVYLEDIRARLGLVDKLAGLLTWQRPLHPQPTPDTPAVILFTSGSEGVPKGVVLSHRNVLSNVAQAQARIDFGRTDKLFNALPVFHSFGFTAGLMLPLIYGVPVYLYPSPLHYRIVPELVYWTNATMLFGTDTFLNGYARTAHAYDFRSLRMVVAGAEAVRPETRQVYMEKFGTRILEGYGVTETSPVVAVNTPMYYRSGTVGRILPGIEARLEPVEGIAGGGRLYVRGANIMLGYLKPDRPGVLQPPHDGWHDTGDIVDIDPIGFITIKGRAKRFAKIGGEMVSLAAVETIAESVWPGHLTAVVARADPRKGERLVLLTQMPGANRSDFVAKARALGAADIMLPAEVVTVEKLPLLGSGKIDYPAVARFYDSVLG